MVNGVNGFVDVISVGVVVVDNNMLIIFINEKSEL